MYASTYFSDDETQMIPTSIHVDVPRTTEGDENYTAIVFKVSGCKASSSKSVTVFFYPSDIQTLELVLRGLRGSI